MDGFIALRLVVHCFPTVSERFFVALHSFREYHHFDMSELLGLKPLWVKHFCDGVFVSRWQFRRSSCVVFLLWF